MEKTIIYTVDGDNLYNGFFLKLENAVKTLEGMAYKKVSDLDIDGNSKAVYSRETEGMFGAPKIQYAYIGFVFAEG